MARTLARAAAEASPGPPAPRANPLLVGQPAAEATVLRALSAGRMTHAWLLTGPRGIGKATLAFRMARLILAGTVEGKGHAHDGAGQGHAGAGPGLFGADPPAADDRGLDPGLDQTSAPGLRIDPGHPVFQRVAAGSHADLRVIERSFSDDKRTRLRDEIVIGDVRGLGGFLSLTPAEGGWRVVVIDAADEMNRNAANAVLKVLEEPPRRAVLFLVAHNPARLPATIPSRCRALALRPLAQRDVAALLTRYRPDLDDGARETLVALARGSIGRALDLAREGGLELYGDLMALLEAAPHMDVARCHALGDKVARDDGAWRLFRDLLPAWLARLARHGATGGTENAGGAPVPPGEQALLTRLARAGPLDRWVAVWEKTAHLLGRAEAVNLDRKQAVLAVLLLIERAATRSR